MLIIITPGFPTDEKEDTCLPAVQQFMLSLLEFRSPTDITVITLQYPFTTKTYLWHGIRVYPAGGANSKGLSRIRTWIRTWQLLSRCRRTNKVEAILALWLTEASLLAQYFGMFHGIRRFFWMQGQDAKKENKYVRLIRPDPNQVFGISNFNAEELYRHHGIRPHLIAENGIRPMAFPELKTTERTIDLFAAGSLIPLKNYAMFLETIALAVSQKPGLRAMHAGEGPLAEQLKNMAKQLGIENNIIFLGKTQHVGVLELMNNSRIFMHTSSYEGSSTVIAEALFSGCQVISTMSLDEMPIRNLHLCGSVKEMADTALALLNKKIVPERIVHHYMRDTAKLILEQMQPS